MTYSYDQDYQDHGYRHYGPEDLTLSYDPASNISSITDGVNSNRSTFQYDSWAGLRKRLAITAPTR